MVVREEVANTRSALASVRVVLDVVLGDQFIEGVEVPGERDLFDEALDDSFVSLDLFTHVRSCPFGSVISMGSSASPRGYW